MISHLVNRDLITNLVIVIALFAVFAWCVQRNMLLQKEVVWVGAAMTFFAASLVFNAVLRADRPIYGVENKLQLIGMSALMTLPLVAAYAYGIFALFRSLRQVSLAAVQIGQLNLRLILGNLAVLKTEEPIDALIYPANTELRMTVGVAGALKSLGGREIELEALKLAPIAIGQAVSTSAGKLRAKSLIHAAIVGRDRTTDSDKIENAASRALKCAKKIGARRVAMADFASGASRLAPNQIAPIIVQAAVAAHSEFDEIVIVVLNSRRAPAFQREFAKLAEQHPAPPAE